MARYCSHMSPYDFNPGTLPLLITVPHGIHLDQSSHSHLNERATGLKQEELNIIETAQALCTALTKNGKKPALLIARVHRSRIDFGRSPHIIKGESAYDDPRAAALYAAHETCIQAWKNAQPVQQIALLIDLHGCRTETHAVFFGTRCGITCPARYLLKLQTTMMHAGWDISPLPGQPERQFYGRGDSIISRHNLAARSANQASLQIELSSLIRNTPHLRQRLAQDLAAALLTIFESSAQNMLQ